jgi:hypothetical protein
MSEQNPPQNPPPLHPTAGQPPTPPPPAPPRAPSPSTRDTAPGGGRPPYHSDPEEPEEPKHDLTKRFHITAGKTVLGTYDTREEADQAHERYHEHRNGILAEAATVSHLSPTKIIDRGTKFAPPEPEPKT